MSTRNTNPRCARLQAIPRGCPVCCTESTLFASADDEGPCWKCSDCSWTWDRKVVGGTKLAILELLNTEGNLALSVAEIATKLGKHASTIRQSVKRLSTEGKISSAFVPGWKATLWEAVLDAPLAPTARQAAAVAELKRLILDLNSTHEITSEEISFGKHSRGGFSIVIKHRPVGCHENSQKAWICGRRLWVRVGVAGALSAACWQGPKSRTPRGAFAIANGGTDWAKHHTNTEFTNRLFGQKDS